jgi:fimbrial isopeptide formation D2 family protein
MAQKKSILLVSLIIIISSICSTATAATQAQIDVAINRGVAWLAAQQNSSTGYWQDTSTVGSTGFALVKLEERAFELGYTPFDPNYLYKLNVEKGLAYLFSQVSIISISNQLHGNPDTDGDGIGIYINSGSRTTYETGIVMMAIAASRAPDRIVNSPGSPVNGWTYKKVLQEMVDFMAFGQCDSGTGRGGWYYYQNTGSADNSNSGYAASGLGYAESPRYGFNCAVPQFVKDELKIWIDYVQTDGGDDDGGSGYAGPGSANILRTGNLVFQMTFAGISLEDLNMQRALAYIGRKWNDTSGSGWGNNCQAMYCTTNGLQYSCINTIVVNGSPRVWYSDFADALVNAQQSAGYWSGSPFGGNVLGTEWALLTLEMLTGGPLPSGLNLTKVDDVNDGDCVGPGRQITYTIDYNYQAGPCLSDINNVNIIDNLPNEVDFNSASNGGVYNSGSRTVTWNIGTLHPGDSCSVTLTVKVNTKAEPGGIITNRCELTSGDLVLGSTCEYTLVCWPQLPGCIIYVDANAPDCHSFYKGTSWQCPYTNLQDALRYARAVLGPCHSVEVRVADGTYEPDRNSANPNGSGDREATFVLINKVAIYGGYAGYGAPNPNARYPNVYETILSGDLNGNDVDVNDPCDLLTEPNRAENSYHVVTASDVNETAIIDGFTIAGGNANSGEADWSDNFGGGTYNSGSPTVRNCIFTGNSASSVGGGMYDSGTSAITNCTFTKNSANSGGGYAGPATVTNCILWSNKGGQISGAASVTYSDIQGGWSGIGNIDGDPMLELDGYHLTPSSPCIDAGDPYYVAGPNETDIDGGQRIIDGDHDGKAIVDMGADEYLCLLTLEKIDDVNDGNCVKPGGEINYTIYYSNPITDPCDPRYVGIVNDVNIIDYLPSEVEFISASGPNCVQPDSNTIVWNIGTLLPGDANCVTLTVKIRPCVERGSKITNKCEIRSDDDIYGIAYEYTLVCSNYTLIDSFEFYTATGTRDLSNKFAPIVPRGSLRRTWIDGLWTVEKEDMETPITDGTSGSYVQLNTDPCDGNNVVLPFSNKGNIAQGGLKSMKFYYDNGGTIKWISDLRLPLPFWNYGAAWNYSAPNYSEASAAVDDAACLIDPDPPFNPDDQNSLGMLRDWSGYKLLKLSYYGDPCNTVVSTDKLYVTLTDGNNSATVTNPDQTIIQKAGWHYLYIPLIGSGSFKEQNALLDLRYITRIYIGIGNGSPGGKGAVFFDDIRLYPVSVCIPGSVVGDFTCDCIVNYDDLKIMRDEWLTVGIADINLDGIVNFKDLALFANNWMVGPILFP